MRYRATWIDAGHPLQHEADTVDAIVDWGERMLSDQVGVVWVTVLPDGSEKMLLAEFKRRFSVSQKE